MKRIRLMQRIGNACAEVVFAYPNFSSVEEGLEWIRSILDPYYTGIYGITED